MSTWACVRRRLHRAGVLVSSLVTTSLTVGGCLVITAMCETLLLILPSAPDPPLQMRPPPAPVPPLQTRPTPPPLPSSWTLPVPPLQTRPTPPSLRRYRPQQPAVVSNLAMDQVLALLSAVEDPFFECKGLGLQAKRALACTCSTLRPVIFQLLRQPRLVVQESDATWDNARFVAIVLVPNVPDQALCVAGETCVPEMKLAHLRTLPKLTVGAMGPTAALFFGAAIAESDTVLRLSTGATKSLKALRENDKVSLQMVDISQPSDRNAMLGALTLNAEQHVTVMVGRYPWCGRDATLGVPRVDTITGYERAKGGDHPTLGRHRWRSCLAAHVDTAAAANAGVHWRSPWKGLPTAGAADPMLYFGHILLQLAGTLYKEGEGQSWETRSKRGGYQFGEVVVEGATLRYISLKGGTTSAQGIVLNSGGNIQRLELTGRV